MPPQFWPNQFNSWHNNQPGPWMTYPSGGYNPRNFNLRAQAPSQHEVHMVDHSYQPTREFAEAFNTMTLAEPSPNWYMDSAASSHLASSPGILQSVVNLDTENSVIVGDGSSIPIQSSGKSLIPSKTHPLTLNNVLVAPKIVKNLIYVRRFTTDNWCSVEFDPFVFFCQGKLYSAVRVLVIFILCPHLSITPNV